MIEINICLTKKEIQDVLENLEQCISEGYIHLQDPIWSAMKKFYHAIDVVTPKKIYACMENMNCGCPEPYHTIFETTSKEEAEKWVNEIPPKRKYVGFDK